MINYTVIDEYMGRHDPTEEVVDYVMLEGIMSDNEISITDESLEWYIDEVESIIVEDKVDHDYIDRRFSEYFSDLL